jgi:5'-nucleotidase
MKLTKILQQLIANTGNVRFTNSSAAIVEEGKRLKEKGVDIIIVLSHCGHNVDMEMAKQTEGLVDVIIGAHTHTLLYNGDVPANDTAEGTYPVVVESNGHKTLIVQALAYGKYVGDLLVKFDDWGEVVAWEGNPVYVSNKWEKNNTIETKLTYWRKKVEAITKKQITTSQIAWPSDDCRMKQCNIALLVADSMVDYVSKKSISI